MCGKLLLEKGGSGDEWLPPREPQLKIVAEEPGPWRNVRAFFPSQRFARKRRQGVRGYTNFVSLLVGAVHFFLQFLQELGALLGGQFALQFLEREGDDVVMVRARKLGI